MQTTIQKKIQKEIQNRFKNRFKKCYFCSEIIHIDAKKCRYCGEFLDPKLRATPPLPKQKWSPTTAALLSLLVPGGGHIYRNKPIKGFLWLLFVAVGYSFYLLPGLFLHLVSILFAVMGNPTEE